MAGPGQRLRHQSQGFAKFGPCQQRSLADAGSDGDISVLALNTRKLRKAHDVDQRSWPGQTHVEHRHQRLSARDDARIAALVGEPGKHLVEMFGADIVECGGLHRGPPNHCRSLARSEGRRKPDAPPPAWRASEAKNCPMITRAAPSRSRPPMLATLPPMPASYV